MRILVVDDTDDARQTIRAMAESLGHEVVEAENAIVAVQRAAADPPDLVLMDFSMPNVDGAQAAGALRKISPLRHLPIVLITAFPRSLLDRTEGGAWDALLIKPFNVDDLERAIGRFAA